MASTRGRQVVVPLTNKSGGAVIAGDVVIVDTANNEAFTTTTTGRAEVSIGVAQEAIASNAVGRVLTHGYAALVNVPSSVTRGHYAETHTVVKQAAGSASRRSGSFGQFLTGGTTPTAVLWGQTDQTASGVTAHSALTGLTTGDDHTQYQKESEKGAASGYAGLDSGGLVPVAQLGTGTPTGAKFLRDDQTYAVPSGGGGGGPTLLLNFNATTDIINGVATGTVTWTTIYTSAGFTVVAGTSTIEIAVAGSVFWTGGGESLSRWLVDGTDPYPIGGGGGGNILGGPVFITGLAAGAHTLVLQAIGGGAGNAYCRVATQPTLEAFRLQVLEWPA